jgi:Uroporphyrinogen decarboxylase (URO-D)
MKVVTIVAFMLLVGLPCAEAAQRRHLSNSPAVICDNDGHCTTHNAASASVVSNQTTRRKIYTATAVATASPTAGSVTETPAASTKEVATPVVSATEAATTTPAVSTADSELASEVTLQSVRRFDFDAAVLYSETLVVPLGLGTLTAETITTTMAVTAASFTEATIEVMKTTTSVATPTPVARPLGVGGNKLDGIVMSAKTGARARVGVAYAARFQAYIDDLEKNYGARVLFMGGIRPGRCLPESEHPCGKALDVCQMKRGVVDPRCNLPGRVVLGQIAAAHGLFEGGRWCHSDYGHAQIDVTAPACGDSPIYIVRQMKPRDIGAVARTGSASGPVLSAAGY